MVVRFDVRVRVRIRTVSRMHLFRLGLRFSLRIIRDEFESATICTPIYLVKEIESMFKAVILK